MPTPSLNKLLAMIAEVEKCYPKDDWKTTAIRLRKTHYNSTLWNLFLIESITIEAANTEHGVSAETIKTLQSGDVEFKDPDGHAVDMGHIWALINGLSQLNMDHAIEALSGLNAPDALSWVGDIGSVITAYALKQDGPDKSMAYYFNNLAGDADMYGDIDGYGVYFQAVDDALPLSQRIASYYQKNYSKRLSYFSPQTGINITHDAGKNIIDTDSISKIIFPQVKEFTFFWTMHICKAKHIKADISKLYNDDDIHTAIALYVDWIANA